MARFWVQRRFDDGLFWQRNGLGYGPLESARAYDQREVRHIGPAALGLEWVELDDDGQPVEAKPVRVWALSVGTGYWYVAGSVGDETDDLRKATLYTDAERDGMCARDRSQTDAVLVHPDGTVTLDEPAPAIAQPSPYSDTADQPIPYAVTDPVDALETLVAKRERVNVRLARLSRKAMRIDAKIDRAKARLRGGK